MLAACLFLFEQTSASRSTRRAEVDRRGTGVA